jgi:DNA invertase Pin-like site-specific DNA recombinase
MTNPEPPTVNRPAKIAPQHLERWAIVYVRQSHPQQVQRHPESAQVQANLQHLALGWGWPRERIRILNGDQGCSATTTVGRDDFAWLLSEIVMGRVGLVLGFQINRLAREDEACCRLIKACKTFDTLLADQDGVYHPVDFNDHLVLTIKGLMGGFELHQLQQRMQAGRLNRARRGEWLGQQPPGYVIGPDYKLQFDPDEQAQSVVGLIFERFVSLSSLSGLLRHLRENQINLPYRVPSGPNRGQLRWHRPHRETVRSLLRNPAYSGTYTWGRRPVDPRRQVPGRRGSGRVEREPQDCAVFRPDNHSAYITWEQYQDNRRRLQQQRLRGPAPGPARQTVAVLAGLVMCGSCGCRMQTQYTKSLRYVCQRRALDYGDPACQSLAGRPLEQLVAEQILEVVTPAGLELSLQAVAEYERERAALDEQWQQRLQRAHQVTARVFQQYDAVEPDNRMVARTLERQLEEALLAERALEEEYARFREDRPRRMTAVERAEIEELARSLPLVWHAPGTGVAEKRRVARLLLERVIVCAPASSQEVRVHLQWSIGRVTEHIITRPVRSWDQLASTATVLQLIESWRAEGWPSRRMAAELNAAGYRTPKEKPFTAESVRQLLSRGRQGSPVGRPRPGAAPSRAEACRE